MNPSSRAIRKVYLLLLLLHTLAASLIWGINTLFLLDAGLSNAQAFAANAFFTAGLVVFEVPTGVVADTRGRRLSYLLGTLTLAISTLLYLLMWRVSAPFWAWAVTSAFLGLGFTFFSGAVQAWLVDALTFSGFFREKGELESVLAKGEIVEGAAMLCGSVAGGVIAQATNLGVPYILRAVVLALTFVLAFALMRDVGFTPTRGKNPLAEMNEVVRASIAHGLANPPVRWVMLGAPFTDGVMIYAFYAAQPYLLKLYGNESAYSVAGLAAAIVAGAQILGGLLVPQIRRVVQRRTTVLLGGISLSTVTIATIGLVPRFWVAIALLVLWGLVFAALTPVRQAYLNALIPSSQRATVLSFDSLMASSGAVAAQPLLGKAADVWSYPASYLLGAAIHALAVPFIWLARRERPPSDWAAEVQSEEVSSASTRSQLRGRRKTGANCDDENVQARHLRTDCLDIHADNAVTIQRVDVARVLIYKHLAVEIAHMLMHIDDHMAEVITSNDDGVNPRIDHRPLLCPVFTDGGAAQHALARHTVRPVDIRGERSQDPLDVACIECSVEISEPRLDICHMFPLRSFTDVAHCVV